MVAKLLRSAERIHWFIDCLHRWHVKHSLHSLHCIDVDYYFLRTTLGFYFAAIRRPATKCSSKRNSKSEYTDHWSIHFSDSINRFSLFLFSYSGEDLAKNNSSKNRNWKIPSQRELIARNFLSKLQYRVLSQHELMGCKKRDNFEIISYFFVILKK